MHRNKATCTLSHSADSGAYQEWSNCSDTGDCIPSTNPASPIDKLDWILKKIHESWTAIEHHINSIASDLGILRDDHKKLADKVHAAEGTRTELVPQHARNLDSLADLQCRIQQLHDPTEDAEGRARRNNTRIVGLPVSEEGANPTKFIKKWLRITVVPHGLSPMFVFKRAHRVPACRPPLGAPPRPIVAWILNYRDRDHLLQTTWRSSPIKVANATVLLFSDYTLEVQWRRASYQSVKKKLCEEGLKYALLFLACLKIMHDDCSLFFGTSNAAWD
ncbi:hypothetical protein NDU88_007491 [Pleurodeles waltl]|uniref:Uncharacterized protein n=1 Tax=Pleurodeles waltl TaxID=8319 RepID=A0AAV7RS28_PLEWA|nr:hypothetical protein NDU88_007491 [Pleurodeles waltl]